MYMYVDKTIPLREILVARDLNGLLTQDTGTTTSNRESNQSQEEYQKDITGGGVGPFIIRTATLEWILLPVE